MTQFGPQAIDAMTTWYEGCQRRTRKQFPMGTISGCLVLLERLQTNYDLSFANHITDNGYQVRGASGPNVRAILARFGETRPFTSEGGRTNRGLPRDVESLLAALESLGLDAEEEAGRNAILQQLQQFLVDRVREFHNQQRLVISYDSRKSTWQNVHDILNSAKEHQCYGAVAQYLVGAKLQLRFPNENIGNDSYSTADQPTGRDGDFTIGHTAFHVTVAPQPGLFLKCQANIRDGMRVFVLVPDDRLAAARQMADQAASEMIAAESIESFVGQNVEELSGFSKHELQREFLALLSLYNERVDATEMDKSMMIDIPGVLDQD